MIDADGFRANVGIILSNHKGQLLWARRVGGMDAWQFPQGGIKGHETPEQALFRELNEEIGLQPSDVQILDVTKGWLKYRLPKNLIRENRAPVCIGQKQKWYLLQLLSDDTSIKLDNSEPKEFDTWQWVSYWYPMDNVVSFKRNVYRRALTMLSPAHSRLESQYDLNKINP